MDVIFYEEAREDLKRMERSQLEFFARHIKKIAQLPPRRHQKFGMPFNVEEIGQDRIIYQINEDQLLIIRCFTDHKDYEKWYRSRV